MPGADAQPLPPLPPLPAGGTDVAYAIFEGGGARGITHIGAVKALERERIELIGVAGASAGAIIAALLAAGFTADELFDPDGGTDILSARNTSPTGLLGAPAWKGFQQLRRRVAGISGVGLTTGAALGLLALAAAIWWADRWALLVLILLLAAVGFLIWPWLRQLAWPLLRRLGLFDTAEMARELNDILRKKLKDHYDANGDIGREPPTEITFRDLDPVDSGVPQCRRLKIVVSDIATGSVRIFDRSTPGVSVAQAVAASASIPLFFAPPRINGATDGLFADGGLVSNLPVWVFANDRKRQERDLERRIPVIAFKLQDSAAASTARPGSIAALIAHGLKVLRTGIFGSQSIISDVLPDVVVVGLPSRLDTFQFDLDRPTAVAAWQDGFAAAANRLGRRRLERSVLQEILDEIRNGVPDFLPPELRKPETRVRVSLLDPDRRYSRHVESFRIVASSGMDGDADAHLEIDSRSRGAPSAWASRTLVYVEDLLRDGAKSRHMTRAEDALIWRGLQSLIAVPIFARPADAKDNVQIAQRILCIDANVLLRPLVTSTAFDLWLRDRIVLLSYQGVEDQIDGIIQGV